MSTPEVDTQSTITTDSPSKKTGTGMAESLIPKKQKHQSHQSVIKSFTIMNEGQRRKADKALAYFVATDMQPYSIVEQRGFRHFMSVLQPSYTLPSRKILTDKLIPSLYNETIQIIQDKLNQAMHIAFTTDCWTSEGNHPYISLTAHLILDWKLESFCLNCRELGDDHTGENLAEVITHLVVTQWNLPTTKVSSFTTDCGSNVVKCFELLEDFLRINCFGHAINNGVNAALTLDDIEPILTKMKKIQNKYAHSWKFARELKKVQNRLNFAEKKLPSYSKTRWWSFLKLMEFVVEQNVPLSTLLSEFERGKYRYLTLSVSDIDILSAIILILKPIHEITDLMAGEKYVTASAILPVINEIVERFRATDTDETQIDPTVNVIKIHFIQKIVEYLNRRYIQDPDINLHLKKCKILDARFKTKNDFCGELKESILNEMSSIDAGIVASTNMTYTPQQKKAKRLGSFLKSAKNIQHLDNGDEREIDRYLKSPQIDPDDDPLQ